VYNGVYNSTEAAYAQYGNSKSVRLLPINSAFTCCKVVYCGSVSMISPLCHLLR